MRRLYGSDDLFPDTLMDACHPFQSINYVCSHDGFTLYDQVAYNERHNWVNGEENRDGHKENYSWNCGWEGDEDVPEEVLRLRLQQAKNFCCLLMLANGTPMFRAGDEFLHTQNGNNNPYNQDNELTWLDWSRLESYPEHHRFFRQMIAFRKAHPSIARSRYWREDVRWYGTGPTVDWSETSRHFAYFLAGQSQQDIDLYVMINLESQSHTFTIQDYQDDHWRLVVDTSQASPNDIHEPGEEPLVSEQDFQLQPRSIVVLRSSE